MKFNILHICISGISRFSLCFCDVDHCLIKNPSKPGINLVTSSSITPQFESLLVFTFPFSSHVLKTGCDVDRFNQYETLDSEFVRVAHRRE